MNKSSKLPDQQKKSLQSQLNEEIETLSNSDPSNILDSIMILTENKDLSIRSVAFQTIGNLLTYSKDFQSVKVQIVRDLKIPVDYDVNQSVSQDDYDCCDYYKFIKARLNKLRENYINKNHSDHIEAKYSGLFSLLNLT